MTKEVIEKLKFSSARVITLYPVPGSHGTQLDLPGHRPLHPGLRTSLSFSLR